MSPALVNVEKKLAGFQKGIEMFIPMDKLASVHNEIVNLDKTMIKLMEGFKIPKVDRAEKDVELIEMTVQKLLEKMCGPSLSKNVFESVSEENQQ